MFGSNFHVFASFAGRDRGCAVHGRLRHVALVKERVVYKFTDNADGGFPQGGVITDAQGNLYGTTMGGGATQDGAVMR